MARIRYLKPDFFRDEDLAELPFECRLFYAGLWICADRDGRLEDRPKRLKADIYPYDKVDIDKILETLSKPKTGSGRPYIQRYEINGEKYIQIINWHKHQKPHHTEKASTIPPAPPLNTNGDGNGDGNGECLADKLVVKEPLKDVDLTVKDVSISIINDLNEVLSSNYKISTKNTISLISARIAEGYTLDDFKTVHRKMLRVWGADEKMVRYLRPLTLYGPKFESYLNQKEPQTKLTETGVKAYLIGQSWLQKEVENAG